MSGQGESRPDRSEVDPRDVLRGIRRLILGLDTRTGLRGFLAWTARHLTEHTGAAACGMAARYTEAARDLFLLVPRDGELRRSMRPLDPAEQVHELADPEGAGAGDRFFYGGIGELAQAEGLRPSRVLSGAVRSEDRVVVGVELVDPDPRLVPDPRALDAFLAEVAPAFELAFLHDQLRRERLETRLLQEMGLELGRTLDMDAILNSILDLLRQIVPYDAAVIYLLEEDGLDVVRQSMRGYGVEQEDAVRIKMGQGIVGSVARSGTAEIIPDVARDPRYYNTRPATRSEMVAPLKSGGRAIGVFNLESDRPYAYTSHDLRLLEAFAVQAATAFERARLLEQEEEKSRLDFELRIARRIQRRFLPRARDEWSVSGPVGRTLPSEEVSGDYYDFVERDDGSVALAVADVSGKGVPASLIMASLRAAFRLEAPVENDPAAFCRRLNRFLRGSLRETEFVTGVVGVVDRARRRFRYCNAGHNPPLLLRRNGATEWLETGGILLGAFEGMTYESAEVVLEPGDLILFYTDGVTEAMSPEGEEFGTGHLVAAVRERAGEAPRSLAGGVIGAVRRFVGGPLPDDLTVVVLTGGKNDDAGP